MYEQMSAEERYKDAHDILAPIENSYKQLEHYMDENGSWFILKSKENLGNPQSKTVCWRQLDCYFVTQNT